MSAPRTVDVAPERLDGWVARFTDSHGDVTWSIDRSTSPSSCLLRAEDGSWARLTGWVDAVGRGPVSQGQVPPDPASPGQVPEGQFPEGQVPEGQVAQAGSPGLSPAMLGQDVTLGHEATQCHVPPPPALLVILVRRGGYAVAVVSPTGDLLSHKVGTRYVQSRTAAGGWSQQRYARRRANQADELVGAVVGHAARVLGEGEARLGSVEASLRCRHVGGLVLGGDRTLAAEVLEELATGPLARLHDIPRRELWDLPDPRRAVLDDAVRRARAVRVEVSNA